MRAQFLSIIILFSIIPILVNSTINSITIKEGLEVEDEITTDVTTDSEIEFINKSVIEEKVFEVKNFTQVIEETTTSIGPEYEDNSEDNVPLIDQILNRDPNIDELPKNSSAENVFIYLSKLFSEEIKKRTNEFLAPINEYMFVLQELVSQKCFNSLVRLADRVRKGEPRALKILDSSAKLLPIGLMDGTFTDLGNFDQCLRSVDRIVTETEAHVNGKYCLIKIKAPLPQRQTHLKYSDRIFDFRNTSLENSTIDYILSMAHSFYSNPFALGVCIPSDCMAQDVQNIYNNSLQKFHFEAEVGKDCYTEDTEKFNIKNLIKKFKELDLYSLISIFIIGSMCAVVGLSTFCEFVYNLFNDYDIDADRPLVLSFSIITNVKKLYSLKIKNNERHLQSINGFKLIAIVWIVIANIYLVGYQPQIRSLIKNIQSEMNERGNCLLFQLVLNSWSASQIFFLIGGFLMAYTTRLHLNKNNGMISLIKYVLKRWLRLTPPIVFPILLIYLMPLYSNGGPIFNSSSSQLYENCVNNWWKDLIFITNWSEPNHSCLPHLWFISAYFQLNIIGIIVLFITYNRTKIFNLFAIILTSIGIVFPMYMTYRDNLSAKSPFMNRPLLDEIPYDLKIKHFLTFNHFSAYFIGISIGVNMTLGQTKQKLNTFIRLIFWLILPFISLISLVITFLWNGMTSKEPSLELSIVYNGLNRLLFISSIAWILYECVGKRGGLINKLLSNKLLLPLSRLTYQIYLLNLIIVWFYYFTKRDLVVYRDLELLFITCGVIVLTIVMSLFGYLVFEAPFVTLSKRLFNTSQKSITLETKPKTKSVVSNPNVVRINVENIEINGNAINGKKHDFNEENFDSKL